MELRKQQCTRWDQHFPGFSSTLWNRVKGSDPGHLSCFELAVLVSVCGGKCTALVPGASEVVLCVSGLKHTLQQGLGDSHNQTDSTFRMGSLQRCRETHMEWYHASS